MPVLIAAGDEAAGDNLRLDFGALYNKFLGETERNLREALKVADAMAPCVLWMDEIEKGVATNDNDGGGDENGTLGTVSGNTCADGNVFLFDSLLTDE